MNKKVDINFETLKVLYGRNKKYALPILMIFVSTVLIFKALIPQIFDLSKTLAQRKQEQAKLEVLRNNLNLLSSTNDSLLDSQITLVTKALPAGKDFEGILNAISGSANRAGVSLSNFEFKVGELSKTQSGAQTFPTLQVTAGINEGAVGVSRFVNEIYKSFPLSDIKNIEVNSGASLIGIEFYYKNLPQVVANKDAKIVPLSAQKLSLLDQLSLWDNSSSLFITPLSSPSASPSASSSPF